MEHLDPKTKVAIMMAVMSAMLFAALNQTIVGTALPRIIAELGGMEYFSWVFTIYMLTSSITAILVGKLSDIYGRKPFILIGIGIFITGSFLAGTSSTIIQLIVYRGVQGFGAGMIMSTAFTVVADLFSPRERGKWQGAMSAVFGLASVFGPTLGGYIVDNWDWHWVFWVFLPFGIIAVLLIAWLFPAQPHREKESVDYFGSIFLVSTMIPLLLAFSWAGTKYAWTSLEVLGLFAVSLVAFVIFIWIEKKVETPAVPLHLFSNSIFSISNVIAFIMGMGMFGAIMYMPFFVQGVIGTSATASGFVMMPMTLSMVVASAIGGQIVSRTGKYKALALSGLFIMSVGMLMMSFMGMDTTNRTAVINMIVVGLGLGLAFPIFTLTVQNAVENRFLGVATSTSQLFRQMGGTIGVSVMGTIMAVSMQREIEQALPDAMDTVGAMTINAQNPLTREELEKMANPQLLMDPAQLEEIRGSLPPDMTGYFDRFVVILREVLGHALHEVFLVGTWVLLFALLLTFFLKEIPLRTSNQEK